MRNSGDINVQCSFKYFLLLSIIALISFIQLLSSEHVEFQSPSVIKENSPYVLIIKSNKPSEKFPCVGFTFAFELLESLSPTKVFASGAVLINDFKKEEFNGFSIDKFEFQETQVKMELMFRRQAHNKIFRIRYMCDASEASRDHFFNSDLSKGVIFERKIEMHVPYKIALSARPDIGAVQQEDVSIVGDALIPGKDGLVYCEATEGLPNPQIQILGYETLRNPKVDNMQQSGICKLQWTVQIDDHDKVIQCKVGNDAKNVTLKVYHYMTDILTSPEISITIPRKSLIKCLSKDGYPESKTFWSLITGPPDANEFYNFRDNNATLIITDLAPIHSNWTFECIGSNTIPPTVRKYLSAAMPSYPLKKSYSFLIAEQNTVEKINKSSTGVVVFLILLFIAICVLLTIGFMYKSKIQEIINNFKLGPNAATDVRGGKATDKIKYEEVKGYRAQQNGGEHDDTTQYSEIVATVEPKSKVQSNLGPIDRV